MPDPQEFRVVSVERARALRQSILRPGRPPSENYYPGDDDPETLHLGAFAEDRLVGVATFLPDEPEGTWRLRGMAVAPDRRKRGVGGRLVVAGCGWIAKRGATSVWCNARPDAMSFYQRLGFDPVGEPFELSPAAGMRQRAERAVGEADVPAADAVLG